MKTMDRTQGVRVFEEDCICCCKEKLDSKTREAAAAAAGGKGWWMRAYLSDAGSHAPLSHAASRSRVSSRVSFAVSRLASSSCRRSLGFA